MWPLVRAGDLLVIERAQAKQLRVGELVLFSQADRLLVHRLMSRIEAPARNGSALPSLITKGDACRRWDAPIAESQILGRAVAFIHHGRLISLSSTFRVAQAKLLLSLSATGPCWYYCLRLLHYASHPGQIIARLAKFLRPQKVDAG